MLPEEQQQQQGRNVTKCYTEPDGAPKASTHSPRPRPRPHPPSHTTTHPHHPRQPRRNVNQMLGHLALTCERAWRCSLTVWHDSLLGRYDPPLSCYDPGEPASSQHDQLSSDTRGGTTVPNKPPLSDIPATHLLGYFHCILTFAQLGHQRSRGVCCSGQQRRPSVGSGHWGCRAGLGGPGAITAQAQLNTLAIDQL